MRLGFLIALMGLMACGDEGEGDAARVDTILSLSGDDVNGETVYSDNCAVCHGINGEGGSGPSMAQASGESDEEIVSVVLTGEDEMPSFDNLEDQDIADVLAYIRTNY